MSEFFSVLSVLCILGVYVSYVKQLAQGHSTPNPATWLIWTLVCIINAITYFVVVNANWYKGAIAIVVTLGLCAVSLYALKKGKFVKPSLFDFSVLGLALAVGIFWQTSGDDRTANLLLQFILLISFFPTIVGLLHHQLREKATAWNIAVLSYCFSVLGILFNYQHWTELAFPVINGIIGNGSVAVIVMWQNRKTR